MIFYNCKGDPIAYTDDDIDIFLFSGDPVAYITGEDIYNYKGKCIGWYDNGWVRDLQGNCVFYTENVSTSGLFRPLKKPVPIKVFKKTRPIKELRDARQLKPAKLLSWSKLSSEAFFMQ